MKCKICQSFSKGSIFIRSQKCDLYKKAKIVVENAQNNRSVINVFFEKNFMSMAKNIVLDIRKSISKILF